jgi:hypothetical protein
MLAALALPRPVKADETSDMLVAAGGFAAKESCSCRYVVGQTEELCRAFGKPPALPGLITDIQFDESAKTTTAKLTVGAATVTRVARLTPVDGCLLDRP